MYVVYQVATLTLHATMRAAISCRGVKNIGLHGTQARIISLVAASLHISAVVVKTTTMVVIYLHRGVPIFSTIYSVIGICPGTQAPVNYSIAWRPVSAYIPPVLRTATMMVLFSEFLRALLLNSVALELASLIHV